MCIRDRRKICWTPLPAKTTSGRRCTPVSYTHLVGGINIDIEGRPDQVLIPADSNPGRVSISAGGVGRNIVENIARLGGDVAMISLTGDDVMGQNAKAQLAALGADVSGVQNVSGENTGMYLSILNHRNDMELAICNMDILERITPAFLEERMDCLLYTSRCV